jgi:predicted small metal-binding protein
VLAYLLIRRKLSRRRGGSAVKIDRNDFSMLNCPHSSREMLNVILPRELEMARMFIDCRDYPSEMNCTVAISADSKEELVDAAVQHAIAVHGHHDSPELRQELARMIKDQ